jgi:FkbM family methyltransferase
MRNLIRILRHFTSFKHSIFDTKVLTSLLNKNAINLLDVGAAGGIEPRWKKISRKINYFGFEPDERARMTTPNTKFSGYQLSPFAVGDSDSQAMLNVTKNEGKSSFFFPNQDFLERFPNPSRFSVSKQIELQIKRVDSQDFDEIDFMKLDIQGGELSALKGAEGIFSKVLGVEVEVEFSKLYINQPLFGSIHDFLVERNFEFIDFVNLCRWERKSQLGLGQLVFGDALFLKSPEKIILDELSEEKIRKYLAILYIYNRFDLIERVFLSDQKLKTSLGTFYRLKKKKMRKLRAINMVNRIVTLVYSLCGVEFRSHVIY